jgi:SpoU rRNA methylase family enzyme
MFAQLDEMTDEPVRIAYGRSVVVTLDIGEAVDLVTAVVDVLAEADHQSQAQLRRNEDEIRSAATIREALQ